MLHKYDEETGEWIVEPFVIGITNKRFLLNCIDAWRKEKKYSYEFLGNIIGLKKSTMSQVFSGYRNITLDNLIKLLRVFGWRLAIEEINSNFPQDYEPSDEEIFEADDYLIIQNYIKDYQGGYFKGTYEEYLKETSG
jgi:transcriptional regulator with XRE-family HTH domain